MFWSFSFQLLPDEVVLEDSTKKDQDGIKSTYSTFLTNKRAIFRFDGFGSSLTQSFFYNEITEMIIQKRFFINYLLLKTKDKEFLLNIADVPYWIEKIKVLQTTMSGSQINTSRPPAPEKTKRELLDMLTVLRKNSILSEKEFGEKIQLLDNLKS